MKLHLLIDSTISLKTTENDIVLVSNDSKAKIEGPCKVLYINSFLEAENEEVNKVVNSLFSQLDKKYEVIKNLAYVAYFRPIYMVLYNIQKILDTFTVEEIVLYGGSKHIFFSAARSEGEGNRRGYKTNWLVNEIIYNKFGKNYRVCWVSKKPSLVFKVYHFLRYIYFICSFAISQFLLYIYNHRGQFIIDLKSEKKIIFSIVDLPLQVKHLSSLLSQIKDNQVIFFLASKRCLSTLDNTTTNIVIPELHFLKVIKVINAFLFDSCRIVTVPNINIKSKFLAKEIQYQAMVYYVREQKMFSFFNQLSIPDNIVLVTDMTVGFDIISSHSLAISKGWKHINFQYVSMARVLYPNLKLADHYYLYACRTFDLYKKYSNSYSLYLPLLINNSDNKRSDKDCLTMSIFMQPDSVVYDYLNYISSVLSQINSSDVNVNIIIKPHYRQNLINQLYEIVKGYNFVTVVGLNDSCETLLEKTDIAMSINSSVIFEAMMHKVPCLIYNPNNKYSDLIYNNDICFPEVNFVIDNPSQTMDFLKNYLVYSKEYNDRISSFIKSYNCLTDIASLI